MMTIETARRNLQSAEEALSQGLNGTKRLSSEDIAQLYWDVARAAANVAKLTGGES